MGDEADATIGQRIRLQVPHRPHPERVVHKTHAARSAQRHTGIGGDRRERVSQAVCGPEQHRRPCTRGGRGGQLVGQHGVRNAEQYHVDGLVEVGQ